MAAPLSFYFSSKIHNLSWQRFFIRQKKSTIFPRKKIPQHFSKLDSVAHLLSLCFSKHHYSHYQLVLSASRVRTTLQHNERQKKKKITTGRESVLPFS